MKTLTKTSTGIFRDLYELPDPVVSVYIGMVDPSRDDADLRRRAIRHDLARSHVEPATLHSVEQALPDVPAGLGTVAMFAGRNGRMETFSMPDADLVDQARTASVPHVTPLLQWHQYRPAHVLVMVDRSGADITIQPAGAQLTKHTTETTVEGPDDEIVRNAPGGPAQMRYQRRAEDSWLHNSGAAAEAAAEALESSGAGLLVLGGDVRAAQYFREQLPMWVRNEVGIKEITGSRSTDGSEHHRTEQVDQLIREFVDEQARKALGAVLDQAGPGGLGVQGAAATMRALAMGAVHQLLVSEPNGGPGGPGPGGSGGPAKAWFGPAPTEIADHRSGILAQHSTPKHGPLADVLIRAAVLTDADVIVLPEDLGPLLHQGVGALCRFSIS